MTNPGQDRSAAARMVRVSLVLAVLCVVSACSSVPDGAQRGSPFIELPAVAGWYEGQPVHYVTTDISDATMAAGAGVNFAPRLADALPPEGNRPGSNYPVERIYKFTNSDQGSVLPSAPVPTGPGNRDRAYSPLWVLVLVTWGGGQTPRTLRSEEEVLAAQESGLISLQPTRIVVNCPVIITSQGGALRDARLIWR
ncbi:MAG: hypothetical protein ABIN37_12160 [Burkholderiaceae bacterium]